MNKKNQKKSSNKLTLDKMKISKLENPYTIEGGNFNIDYKLVLSTKTSPIGYTAFCK